jgi:uncharacterized membrane protein
MPFVLAFLIGVFAGLRSLTAPAATAFAAYQGWLRLDGPLAYIGSLPSVIVFTVLAIGEIIMDKLPKTPARTTIVPLVGRILLGALCGACVASAGGASALVGAVLGALGGVAGTFGGYHVRKYLVSSLKIKDFYVALVEDIITIAGCLWVVTQY